VDVLLAQHTERWHFLGRLISGACW